MIWRNWNERMLCLPSLLDCWLWSEHGAISMIARLTRSLGTIYEARDADTGRPVDLQS